MATIVIIVWRFIHFVSFITIIFSIKTSGKLGMRVEYKLDGDLRDGPDNVVDHNIVQRHSRRRKDIGSPMKTPPPQTVYEEDHHDYYKSRYYMNGSRWWYNLGVEGSLVLHKELSENIKFSDTITTSFQFPYYGHMIKNVTITNKGYIFLGERLHKFNASAQYAAPLMADFDINNPGSLVFYVDTGSRFAVEWVDLKLRSDRKGPGFRFQCSIFKNGTIVFAYKKIPVSVTKLSNANFPVRVGLSDTYRRDYISHKPYVKNGKTYSGVHYIYYYLYDKVKLTKGNVVDNAAFVIIPKPNCVMMTSCASCVNSKTGFSCKWCPKLARCSDGVDRYRHEWIVAGCLKNSNIKCKMDSGLTSGEIVLIVLIPLAIIVAIISVCLYAYLHPLSKSGMLLMRYGNPLKWCRNSSETTEGSNGSTGATGRGGKLTFKTMPFENNT